jgi:transposase
MPRYRLTPTPQQELILREHCAHARFVWNLAVEQHLHWRSGRPAAPGYLEQSRQLTIARAEFSWLAAGSYMVQQQALRDFAQAMRAFYRGTHGRPTWRKAGRHEGFRIVKLKPEHIRRLSRHVGVVRLPKAGWVRFRWSRVIPDDVKSCRLTLDRAGRWHIGFTVRPAPIPAPGNGAVVGVDRGVAVSAALSTGDLLTVPRLSLRQQRRLAGLQRQLARAERDSRRRRRTKAQIGRLHARQADIRKDWIEKTSSDLARRFDLIRIENLQIKNMTRSAKGTVADPGRNVAAKTGLNREILASGWGELGRRLEDKAPGRVERVNPAYTSQRCSECGKVDAKARESQAVFACRSCSFTCNADVNAARNIAAGHAVTARGGFRATGPLNREPQPALLSASQWVGIPTAKAGRMPRTE